MIDRSSVAARQAAIYSLFGYFLSTTFSHALAQIFFACALFFVIVLFFYRDGKLSALKPDLFWWFIILYVVWSAVSSLVGPTPIRSLSGLKEEWLFLMIPTVAYLARDERFIRQILKIFAISVIIISAYAIFQHFTGMDIYRGTHLAYSEEFGYRVQGTFSHRLTYGNYFAVAAIICLAVAPKGRKNWHKLLFYIAFSLATMSVAFTFNRSSILALVIGILLFVLFAGRKLIKPALLMIALVIIAVIIISPDIYHRYTDTLAMEIKGTHQRSRMSTWRTGLRMFADNPVFGVGPGNFHDNSEKYRDKTSIRVISHAHNDVLNVAAYAGFPAAVFYLGFWVVIFVRMVRHLRRLKEKTFIRAVIFATFLGSAVFFITSLSESTFADEEVRLLLMAVWGLYFGAEWVVKRGVKMTETIEKA